MELLRFPRATVFAIGSATLLLAANVTPIHAQSGPDLPTIAEAYGEYWLFIFNVAAGNDGQSVVPAGEQAFVAKLAQSVLYNYPRWAAAQRRHMAQYPASRDYLWQVWPTLPIGQRLATQQQWAANVEPGFLAAGCDVVQLLASASLVPAGQYLDANYQRVVQCEQPSAVAPSGGISQGMAAWTLENGLQDDLAAKMSFAKAIGD